VPDPPGSGTSYPITAVSDTSVSIAYGSSGSWTPLSTKKIKRDPASYGAVSGSPFTVSTSPFVSLFVPQASLSVFSNYYARTQYATTNTVATTSSYSPWSKFTTATTFTIPLGTVYGGGYYGGQINVGGTIYNLVVAPKTSGTLAGEYNTAPGLAYKTGASSDTPSATFQDLTHGAPATVAGAASVGTHPMFEWCIEDLAGPNAGTYDATNAAGTGIGGYNDWYIPAKNELEILYRNLKPTSTANNTFSGSNANAVPAATGNYSSSNPEQTSVTLFRSGGGAEAFDSTVAYWSATENSGLVTASWTQSMSNGQQASTSKINTRFGRAIRRVQA
jgi:hypothetical protein